MVKKSRKVAAKYSELSKAKKRKQRAGSYHQTETVSVSGSQSITESKSPKRSLARQATRTQPELKRGVRSYEYVRTDLKKIGVLAGAMIIVLIIFAFVLG